MNMKRTIAIWLVLIFGALATCCSHKVHVSGTRYLKCNIHAQVGGRDTKASYANWTDPGSGHLIVPINSEVAFNGFRKGFMITVLNDGRKIYFEYNASYMGMDDDQYINLISSPTPVNIANLSELDTMGVKEGKARLGMTKEGVMMALGYPAGHKTPSLHSNTWIYWQNRWKTIAIEFDDSGRVKNIRD
jgi:hypothetical protein